jgi:hypothetical protein
MATGALTAIAAIGGSVAATLLSTAISFETRPTGQSISNTLSGNGCQAPKAPTRTAASV